MIQLDHDWGKCWEGGSAPTASYTVKKFLDQMEEYIFTQGRPFFKELSMLIIEAIEESHIALNRGRSN